MSFADAIRYWLILLYVFNILVFVLLTIRFRSYQHKVEKKKGAVPTPGGIIFWGIPLFFLATRFGELQTGWWLILISFVLSISHVVMHAGALLVLDRFYIPGSGVTREHKLITSGPFRYVRHPIFSAFVALWLAAVLGTMNWVLLVLWPVYTALILLVPIRQEEELLSEKFGEEYASYRKAAGKIVPKF